MITRSIVVFAFLCGVICYVAPARAEDPSQVTIGAGVFELTSPAKRTGEFDATFRLGTGLFDSDGAFRGLKPMIGVMANAQGGFMGWAGLAAPVRVTENWEVEPSVGLGGYHQGDSKDLGGTFQFHLGLNVSRAIGEQARVGVALEHVSNAGLHDRNPGENSALVTVSWSL